MLFDKIIRVFFRVEKWNVGILPFPIATVLNENSVSKAIWMDEPPGSGFVADPFGLVQSSKIHVLFEQVFEDAGKGIISAVSFSDGTFSASSEAMKMPVHMSYPYVFEEEGNIYCIPETCEEDEVALYKAQDFPHKWTKESVLLENFSGVDNTVFKHDGRWWLMCTTKANKGADRNLHIFYSQDLHSGWEAHAMNPVKIDVASARPGGTPFVSDGKLYRPSQDSSKTYGGRIVINEIKKLTPEEFEEQQVTFVEPDKNGPYPEGLHTLSSVGNYTLIDGKRFKYSLVKPFGVLTELVKKRVKNI